MGNESDPPGAFELADFLPYLLNEAAETASRGFQPVYKARYGMLRTEWRVLFHLGQCGEITATELAARAKLHKTKISRAVAALEKKRFLKRVTSETDRRVELLSLTPRGREVLQTLSETAKAYDRELAARFSADEVRILRKCLRELAR